MRISRNWAFLMLLYISADFVDPSVPGVFFLDNESLFVDSVIQAKHTAVILKAPAVGPRASALPLSHVPQVAAPRPRFEPGLWSCCQLPLARGSLRPTALPPASDDH